MEIGSLPWLLAVVTAGWFGWTASRAGKNVMLWAVGGAAFGLVASTVVLGLGHSISMPFSDHQRSMDHLKWAFWAVAVIVVGGWVLTSGLHRQHLRLWHLIKREAGTPSTPASKPSTGPRS